MEEENKRREEIKAGERAEEVKEEKKMTDEEEMKVVGEGYREILDEQHKEVDSLCASYKLDYTDLFDMNKIAKLKLRNHNSLLASYSIFRPEATRILKIEELLGRPKDGWFSDPVVSRAVGCMLGMPLADSLGHLLEFVPLDYDRRTITDFDPKYWGKEKELKLGNSFRLKPGQWTDDASMGLCIADSLIMKKGLDCIDLRLRFYQWWNFGYNNAFRFDYKRKSINSVGLGGMIAESLYEFLDEQKEATGTGSEWSSGIGSIMRLAPLPIYYHDNISKAMEMAAKHSLTTHKGREAADCCRLMTYIIIKALYFKGEGELKERAKEFLDSLNYNEVKDAIQDDPSVICLLDSKQEEEFTKDSYNRTSKDRNWDWKSPTFMYSPTRATQQPGYIGSYAVDALAMALHCIYHTSSFTECVLKVVNLGGDADSVGSVAAQIAGAIYGLAAIPPHWINQLMHWDNHGEIPLRALLLLGKFNMEIGELWKNSLID